MSWWRYVLKTDWQQKKADWAEYKTLCQDAECAYNAMLAARARITQSCAENNQVVACVCRVIDNSKKRDVAVDYCPHFFTHDNANGCYRLHCEYAIGNREYHERRKRYEAMRHGVKFFWAKKFARVK